MRFYSIAIIGALLLGDSTFAWPTSTTLISAWTVTEPAYVETLPYTTFTNPVTTHTHQATTELILVEPEGLQSLALTVYEVDFEALADFAQDITSIDGTAATKLASDIDAYWSGFEATRPPLPIITDAIATLQHDIVPEPGPKEDLFKSIVNDLSPYEPSSAIAELAGLVSPYPTLSSYLMEYLSVARTYEAEPLLAEASIVSKDLSLTDVPPSWISLLSQALPTGTDTGTAATATSTGGAVAPVALGAGAAAAGMVVLAML